MSARIFADTNLLVYSRDSSEPSKQPRAQAWRTALWQSRAGRLSVQVLEEYYTTVTRKLSPGMPKPLARAEVDDLALWRPVVIAPELLQSAWQIEERFLLSFWDALIIAAAQAADCTHLLTEDLQAGASYDGLLIVNPFALEPEALLG